MSIDRPMVSVIVNCYNGEEFLEEAIDSIYRQDYKDWEVIFWDNASTDKSAKIARSYDSKLKYYLAEKTTSLGEARNLALQQASGKYISFLDCDDRYLPGKIGHQVGLMEKNECALCYGSVIVINENGMKIRRDLVTDKFGSLIKDLLLMYEINMQSVMIRRSVLDLNELSFDISLEFSPDYDLFMRIAAFHDLCSTSQDLVEYRKVGNSLTSKMLDYIGPEMGYTVDSIKESLPRTADMQKSIDYALRMVEFYKSLPLIKARNYKAARRHVMQVLTVKKIYIIYYVVLLLPVSPRWILKMIMR